MTSLVPTALRLRTPAHGAELRPVAPHRILAELGQGGMANVYLAVTEQQRVFSKLVVLKALKRELAMQPSALVMFLDEARVAARLNHPNIVQTYDVGLHHDRHVLVMEYLDGQPLSALLNELRERGRELPLRTLIRVMISALEGLHYAHELTSYDGKPLAMVHRDVSPHNIFVTYDGHVKVLDFGIAKAATSSTETLTGVIKGKLSYMAPEQLAGEEVDRRADIYSVGCILWALASGQKLWVGLSDPQIVKRILYGSDVRVPQGFAERQPEFARIVEKCLMRDPNARYQTAAALQHDLERLAERLGPPVRQKDIAGLVSELFHEERDEFKRLVQDRLKGRSAYVSVPPAANPGAEGVGATLAEPLARKRTVLDPPAPARSGRKVIVAVVVVALGAAVFAASGRGPRIRDSLFASAPAADSSPAHESPPPERTPVRFSVSPAEAVLYLDGARMPSSTVSIDLPRDATLHTLRAEAPGHAPKSVEFVVNEGLVIGLGLTPLAPVPPQPSAGTEAEAPTDETLPRQPAATRNPRRRASRRDCSKPFYLDSNGIKRVRAECR